MYRYGVMGIIRVYMIYTWPIVLLIWPPWCHLLTFISYIYPIGLLNENRVIRLLRQNTIWRHVFADKRYICNSSILNYTYIFRDFRKFNRFTRKIVNLQVYLDIYSIVLTQLKIYKHKFPTKILRPQSTWLSDSNIFFSLSLL